MAPKRSDVDTRELRLDQERRADEERRQARQGPAEEAEAHARRAEKSGYLRDKLQQAERSEDEPRDQREKGPKR